MNTKVESKSEDIVSPLLRIWTLLYIQQLYDLVIKGLIIKNNNCCIKLGSI